MRGQFGHTDLGRVALDDGPNHVGGESVAVDAAALVDGAEHAAVRHTRRIYPLIDRSLHPVRDRHRAPAFFPSPANPPAPIALRAVGSLRPKAGPARPFATHRRATTRGWRDRVCPEVSGSGSESSRLAWSRVSQFPARGPSVRAPGTFAIPAASSGNNKPLSAASVASFLIAASWTLIAEADKPRPSSSAR